MENKYKWLAAQIDNIYRECSTVNMNGVAKLIQDTIERPEPLIPGVRYANTEKNRARILMETERYSVSVTVGFENIITTGYLSKVGWLMMGLDNPQPLHKVKWFALIPDGEVQDG
jgi:hypothetical protein